MSFDEKCVDEYYTRKEWMIRVKNNFVPSSDFINFCNESYNIIKLKNQIKRYFILKSHKRFGHAMEVIETELDYSQTMLLSLLTNSYLMSNRSQQQGKERALFRAKIEIQKQKIRSK